VVHAAAAADGMVDAGATDAGATDAGATDAGATDFEAVLPLLQADATRTIAPKAEMKRNLMLRILLHYWVTELRGTGTT